MLMPKTKSAIVWTWVTETMVMPPRMPIVLDGVVMVIGALLLILPPTRRNTPCEALMASSPFLSVGIEDELVDGEPRVGADRERAAVEEHQMGAVRWRCVVINFVGLHVDADAQDALGSRWAACRADRRRRPR